MQFKNLLTSSLLLALLMPLSVLGGKGRISYYEPKPSKSQPPSCGSDSIYLGEYYVALNKEQLDSDKSSLCGKCVKIVYKNKYLVGRVVDRCSGCGYGGLDISPSMFRHFEELKTGIFNTNWEYVSCDHYGKKGTCSDSSCGISGSSSGSDSKPKSTTTTTTKAAPTTTSVKPTTTNASPVSPSTSSPVSSTTVVPNASNTITSTTTNATNSTEVQSSADPSIIGAANNNSTITQTPITNSTDANNNSNNNNNEPVIINDVENGDKEGKDDSGSLVIPVTGVLMVSGAAGIGLLYAKSKHNDVNSLKKAFPEAFKSIKRSLTHGSSIRRNITRTFTKKRPELRNNTNTVDSVSNGKAASTSQCAEMDISETRINVN